MKDFIGHDLITGVPYCSIEQASPTLLATARRSTQQRRAGPTLGMSAKWWLSGKKSSSSTTLGQKSLGKHRDIAAAALGLSHQLRAFEKIDYFGFVLPRQ